MTEREKSPETNPGEDPASGATDGVFYLVTSSDAKYRTAVDVFEPEITFQRTCVDVSEVQSTDPETVIEQKAEAAYEAVGAPVLVDDFSFFLDGLNGFPGPLVKHLLKETGLRGLRGLSHVSDSGCTLRCTAAIYDGKIRLVTNGELRGTLDLTSDYADSTSNQLLSTVFIPDGYDLPLSELQIDSHRHGAYTKLKERIHG